MRHQTVVPSLQGRKRKATNTGFIEQRSRAFPLEPDPWLPAPYDKADVAAFRALREGRADPNQQQICLEWLIYACGTYENPFRPGLDGARATDFAAAKQSIGQQIIKLINLPAINEEQGEQG